MLTQCDCKTTAHKIGCPFGNMSEFDQTAPRQPQFPIQPNTFPSTPNRGWECPTCHKCYAPWARKCDSCGESGITITMQQDGI